MHACVGPATGHHSDKPARDFRDRLLQRILQCALTRLKLPPGKIGAVIGEREFDGSCHGDDWNRELQDECEFKAKKLCSLISIRIGGFDSTEIRLFRGRH
jgi:hypothetical protein